MMVYLFDTLLVHQELVVMQCVVDAKVLNAGVANSHFLENNQHITITKRAILVINWLLFKTEILKSLHRKGE